MAVATKSGHVIDGKPKNLPLKLSDVTTWLSNVVSDITKYTAGI